MFFEFLNFNLLRFRFRHYSLKSFFSDRLSYFLLEDPNFRNFKTTINFEISPRGNGKLNEFEFLIGFTFSAFVGKIRRPGKSCTNSCSFNALGM